MAKDAQLYVMQAGDGVVKVGFSIDPENRSIQLGRLPLLHVTDPHEQAALVERAAHKLLKIAGCHVNCELFSASLQEAIEAIDKAVDLVERNDPWLKTINKTKQLQVRVNSSIERKLLDLRKAEPDLPSKSEMVIRLVDRAYEELQAKDRKRK